MAGLEPGWREAEMDERWADENLPFTLAEYTRIRDWWEESGALGDVWRALAADLGKFYQPLEGRTEEDCFVPESERAGFIVELYDWWLMDDLSEFMARVSDGGSVETWPDDEDEWQEQLDAWWASGGPSRIFAFVAERTAEIRPTIVTRVSPPQ
jgi:hypothetical protein